MYVPFRGQSFVSVEHRVACYAESLCQRSRWRQLLPGTQLSQQDRLLNRTIQLLVARQAVVVDQVAQEQVGQQAGLAHLAPFIRSNYDLNVAPSAFRSPRC